MPAFGPGDPPPVVVRRKRRVQRRERAAQSRRAHAQEAGYVSQGRAVQRVARKQRAASRPRVVRTGGDTKSDVSRGEDFKGTRQYRGAVVAAYDSLSGHEKHVRVSVAAGRVRAGTAGPEDHAILHAHRTRVAGSRKRASAAAAYSAISGTTPRDVAFPAPKVRRRGLYLAPGVRKPGAPATKGSIVTAVKGLGGAIRAVGEASSKGYAGVHAPKILQNAPKDLADLVVTTPSSLAKLGSDVVHHPERVPGELAAPYVELAKHPRKFVEERPVSALLMAAPVARAPGRVAGRVARVAGKQTLERPAAVFEGTNLKEVRTGSRDYLVRRRQARQDVKRGAPQMTEAQVNARVDAFFDASRRTADRMVGGAERDARRQGLAGDEFAAKIRGARKGARKVVRRKFAQEFGGELHPSKEAAQAAQAALPFAGRVMKTGKNQFTNVPEFAADRLRHHESVGSTKALPARILRTSRRAFSRTVLPFNPRWLTGQAVESAFRAMATGAGPVSYVRGARVLRELERTDPAAAAEARARMAPGGLSRVAKEVTTKTLEAEYEGTSLARIAKAATALGRAPIARNVRATHAAMTDWVFDTLNGKFIEGPTQKAMLGRALKESPLMERRVVGLSDKAIKDAAEGLKATEAQVALGREVHKMFGRYSGFSPEMRSLVLHWAPFAPWTGNVLKFLFHVLPAEHPVATALLADIDAAEEKWRIAAGLSFHGPHKPGFLLGSYPHGKKGQVVRVGRYLPFVPGDIGVETLADLLLPQFAGAYRAASGQNPITGRPLHGKFGADATETEKAVGVAVQLVEGMIPAIGQAHRIRSEGANRALNPLAPTRVPPPGKVRRKGAPALTNPLLELGPAQAQGLELP